MQEQPVHELPGFAEPFNAFSHLLGAAVFLVLGVQLVRRGRGNVGRMVFLGIYAASCVLLLAMSGVYHMLTPGSMASAVLARLDHAAIFVLIAGTFTPPHGILFRGWLRWLPLGLIWATAICGVTLKSIYFADVQEWMGLVFYLGMGWLGLISALMVMYRYGIDLMRPLVWGAVAYTAGGVVDFLGEPTLIPGVIGPHELFHVLVLAGMSLHFRFIWRFAGGYPAPGSR